MSIPTLPDASGDFLQRPVVQLSTFALLAALFGFLFGEGALELVRVWGLREEYSYGYFIPFLTLFLIWLKKDELARAATGGSWWGTLVVLGGALLFVVGELSTLYLLIQYAMIVVVFGMVLAFVGWARFRLIWAPLVLLFFMVPLPQFLQQELSSQLQLISSELGVGVIRLFGIGVFLEGNVIDLGSYKLQVVEACNGLRYLFPLMTFGFLAAYLFKAPLWQRAIVFLSTIPITVFMNSFRIGVIGVLVEYFGKGMAEGFLHDFEGWAVFLACLAILVGEIWVLTRMQAGKPSLRDVFGIDLPRHLGVELRAADWSMSKSYVGAVAILTVVAVFSGLSATYIEARQPRTDFAKFPAQLGKWQGRPGTLELIYLDELKLNDYLLSDYQDGEGQPVNLYIAYYDSQRKGESSHSPRTCIPGGGWKIERITQQAVADVAVWGMPLTVNRVEVQRGPARALVYYWFQQRGRLMTNEILVKWFIFQDSLFVKRTDGAMVRLTTNLRHDETWESAEARLQGFAAASIPRLDGYLPR